MLLRFEKIYNDNAESIKNFLDRIILQQIFIDANICKTVNIYLDDFVTNQDDDEVLFMHLQLSKIIAQSALNLYVNRDYYSENCLDKNIFLMKITDESDMDEYNRIVNMLMDNIDSEKESLMEVLKWSTTVYLIVYKVLQSIENAGVIPTTDINVNEEDTLVQVHSARDVPSLSSLSTANIVSHVYTEELEVTNWMCDICDRINPLSLPLCDGCDSAKPDVKKRPTYVDKDKEEYVQLEKEVPKNSAPNNDEKGRQDAVVCSDAVTWKCDKCMTTNRFGDVKHSYCGHCGNRYSKWRCEHCEFDNDQFSPICVTCSYENPFIEPCPNCQSNKINNQYSNLCDVCGNNDAKGVVTNVYDGQISFMRLLQDSFDRGVCRAWINDAKWVCVHCTFRNDSVSPFCIVCKIVKSYDNRTLVAEVPSYPYGKIFCRICNVMTAFCHDHLCSKCAQEYYICVSSSCRVLVGPNRSVCPICGLSEDASYFDGKVVMEIVDGLRTNKWMCSWKRCRDLNSLDSLRCMKCSCIRDTNRKRMKCYLCGWINVKDVRCEKC